MSGVRHGVVCGYLLAAVLVCVVPSVHPVTKGQRVRSSPDIPVTQFSCTGRPPGYYADLETGCQVYHMCTEGGNQFSYKCPNTTLFQQRMLICAHWYQVNCSRSEQHYHANLLIGQRDKPFVNDDTAFAKEKLVKTLHNPDALQNLGQTSREGFARQAKSQTNTEKIQSNRVPQNNYKRDGESSIGNAGKNPTFFNSFSTTGPPDTSGRISEDLSSLPLAGSVLPGGVRSFQFSPSPHQRFPITNQTPLPTSFPRQSSTSRVQFTNPTTSRGITITRSPAHGVSFFSPTTTPNSIERINLFATTHSPVAFTSKHFSDPLNKFQPSGFKKQPLAGSTFEDDTAEPSFEFLPPTNQKQSNDLVVASQENALNNRRSTTTPPPSVDLGEGLPETEVKAVIEQTTNGSLPHDRFNTFLKRFNPYEEPPVSSTTIKSSEPAKPEYHTFINRFVPDDGSSAQVNNLNGQSENDHVFVDRFVLTPEELQKDKDRQQVDKLHNLLPPEDQLTVSFPNFDLMPPFDDSDDSESNKIELHLQDPRRTFFIPSEEGNEFSKADSAPIVVTIPLHSYQKSPPMWFRTNDSEEPCSRCHPSFLVNKETCMPCVVIR